ncbi:MAG: hypothetical protein WCL49_06990 [bacterium]
MKREAIIGLALAGLTLVWQAPAAGAEALTLEAYPVSAGAVREIHGAAVMNSVPRFKLTFWEKISKRQAYET